MIDRGKEITSDMMGRDRLSTIEAETGIGERRECAKTRARVENEGREEVVVACKRGGWIAVMIGSGSDLKKSTATEGQPDCCEAPLSPPWHTHQAQFQGPDSPSPHAAFASSLAPQQLDLLGSHARRGCIDVRLFRFRRHLSGHCCTAVLLCCTCRCRGVGYYDVNAVPPTLALSKGQKE